MHRFLKYACAAASSSGLTYTVIADPFNIKKKFTVSAAYPFNRPTGEVRQTELLDIGDYLVEHPHSTDIKIEKVEYGKWYDNWDRRDPTYLAAMHNAGKKGYQADVVPFPSEGDIARHTPKATRHLILIRHGQYHTVPNTDEMRRLTELGEAQADNTGARLKVLSFPWNSIISSTMTRAQQTARIIQQHIPEVPIIETDLLREGAPVPPVPSVGNWRPPPQQYYQDSARIEASFRQVFHRADVDQKEDTYEIVVCHANVIRFFVCRALQLPPEAWLRMSLHHCSLTAISIRPSGRVVLRALGDCGHMAPVHLTTS